MSRPGFLSRDPLALLFLLASAALSAVAGVSMGQPVVFPFLATIPAALVFLDRVRRERFASALWLMVAWAFFLSVSVIVLTRFYPSAAEQAILRAGPYREEMFAWIQTGQGKEGSPARFLPEHALHYVLFMLVSGLTAGVGGLLMGTVLLNYMAFYVGSLFVADPGGAHTVRLILMGWPIWAIARVIGFIAGGVAMASLTFSVVDRLRDRPTRWPGRSSHYLSLSLALIILDALLKALLAPHWRLALRQILPGAGG